MLSRIVKSDWRLQKPVSTNTKVFDSPVLRVPDVLCWQDIYMHRCEEIQLLSEPGINSEIILPLAGDLLLGIAPDKKIRVSPEEVLFLPHPAGMTFTASGTTENTAANFLRIGLSVNSKHAELSRIYLDEKNKLVPFFQIEDSFSLSAGVFSGRSCAEISSLQNEAGAVFFVINGAFDVSGCLIEHRDILEVHHYAELEIEALSENAIIIVLEKKQFCTNLQTQSLWTEKVF